MVFIVQNVWDLEDYVEQFVNICHRTTYDNLTLMEGFRCGLDDEIRFLMSKGDTCWTLEEYINFTPWGPQLQ